MHTTDDGGTFLQIIIQGGGTSPRFSRGGGASPKTLCISHKQLLKIIRTMFTQSLCVVLGWHSQYTATPNIILNKYLLKYAKC